MKTIAYDCESALIAAGLLDPPLACVTYCSDDFVPGILHHSEAHDFLEQMFTSDLMVGVNISYDFGVVVARFPDLISLVFKAYRENRVRDCMLDQRLIDLAAGELDGKTDHRGTYVRNGYSLAAMHERHGFGALDKSEDTYRLRYGELIPVPLAQWPAAAIEYAKLDALATLRVHRAQQQFEQVLTDSCAQARAAWALHLQSLRGMVTDARMCLEYIEETKLEIARCKALLLEAKLLRPNGTKDTKLAKARMEAVCAEYDLVPKKTATGGISLDAEATRDCADPVLQAYSTFTSADKTLTRAMQLKEGSEGIPLQTSYTTLLNNGRTSSREPSAPLRGSNFQNLNRKGKLRQCFTARPGYRFCTVDYASDELHTVSQCEIWATGKSKLAEALNAGRDVHCEVGATLLGKSYDYVFENRKKDPACKKARQDSKEVNYGGWGVLSAKRLCEQTNKKAERKEDRIDLARAKVIMRSWEKSWEPEGYFDYVRSLFPNSDAWSLTTVKQFISGRVRAHIDFPAACNTFFSGLAADAIKASVYALAEACYTAEKSSPLFGTRPVLYVHDEIIAEVPIERQHEAAYAMAEVMVKTHNSIYTPDVPVHASPALMDFWFKDAEEEFDECGKLLPWYPKKDEKGNPLVWLPEGEKKRLRLNEPPKGYRSPLLASLLG